MLTETNYTHIKSNLTLSVARWTHTAESCSAEVHTQAEEWGLQVKTQQQETQEITSVTVHMQQQTLLEIIYYNNCSAWLHKVAAKWKWRRFNNNSSCGAKTIPPYSLIILQANTNLAYCQMLSKEVRLQMTQRQVFLTLPIGHLCNSHLFLKVLMKNITLGNAQGCCFSKPTVLRFIKGTLFTIWFCICFKVSVHHKNKAYFLSVYLVLSAIALNTSHIDTIP